jgi:competence protein ComEC
VKKIFLFFTFFIANICATELPKYLLSEEYVRSKKDLEIVFLDVGQGDCSFIKTPSGVTILIDAGGSPYWLGEDAYDPGESVVVPYLKSRGITTLDYVIVTHPHGDHFGGMFAVLKDLKVKSFIDNGYTEGDPNYKDLLDIVDKRNIPYEQIKEGDVIEIDKDVVIKVFYPLQKGFLFSDTNNSSIVFKLIYKNFSVLFTGDAEIDLENYLVNKHKKELSSTVLKVPHHGSRTSSSVKFIKTVNPQVAVIMCGRKNFFGHPHNETVSRYNKLSIDLYITAQEGNVIVLSNGEMFTVFTQKENGY